MRKGFILTGAVATLSLLAACSSGGTNNTSSSATSQSSTESMSDKTTLKFAALESGYGDKVWPAIIKAYEEVNPNVTIELTQSKDIEKTLTTQVKAGDYPDVVMLATGRKDAIPETFIKEKALTDLSDVLTTTVPGEDKKVQDKLSDGFINTVTNPYNDGKTYLMPMFYSPTGLFYNKALFQAKGYEVPKTWNDLFALGDKAKADGLSLWTYPTSGYLDSFLPPIIVGRGGEQFFNDALKYKEGTWDSAEMKDVFQTIGKMATYVDATTVANANKENFKKNQQLLLDDKVLFLPNGTWIVDEMKETTPEGFEWGLTAYPAFEAGGDQYAFTFFEQIWVPAEAKHAAEAKEFIAFLYSDKAAEIFAEANAVQPIQNFPFDKLSADNQVFYDLYKNGAKAVIGSFATTEAVEGLDFKGTLYGAIDSVVNGTKTIEEYQAAVVDMMNTLRGKILN